MMLQTMGRPFKASLLAISRQGLFLLPALLVLVPLLGVLGLQLSQPLADVASFCVALPIALGTLREMDELQIAQQRQAEKEAKP